MDKYHSSERVKSIIFIFKDRRRKQMPEPTESVIIQAQQNFDIDGGINPLKIELEDDKIIDILNSICKK